MTITKRYHSDIEAYKPLRVKYPEGYHGAHTLSFRVSIPFVKYDTVLRFKWYGRTTENDWQGIDPYKAINIAPAFAKWFSFVKYYRGMYRNMYHLTVGKFCASWIPLTHGDCCWWD